MIPSDPPPAAAPGSLRELLQVAVPLLASMASFTLMQFVDRILLAHYSPTAIQAALPAGMLSFTLISFFHALAGYASAFVGQFHGAGTPLGCSRATAQGLWVAIVSSPGVWLLIPVGRRILENSGHPPDVLADELPYFTILMAGGSLVVLHGALSSFFNGRGDTRTTMWSTLIGNAVNLVLDYLLIFGRAGFPRMGIEGAAWATVAGSVASVAYLAAIYYAPRLQPLYRTRAIWRPEFPLLRRLILYGAPAALHLTLDVGSFSLFLLLTGRIGGVPLAASNIAFSINNVAFQPLLALNMATSVLVARYQGAGRSETAERVTWTALKTAWAYMVLTGSSFIFGYDFYLRLFRGASDQLPVDLLRATIRPLMAMMAAWGVFDAANMVILGALRGAGDTRFSMLYSTLVAWLVWIPGELALTAWIDRHASAIRPITWMGGGVTLMWGWLAIYVIILALGLLWRFRSGRWKTIRLIEPPPLILPPRAAGDAPTLSE